jgi:hypothetical protein
MAVVCALQRIPNRSAAHPRGLVQRCLKPPLELPPLETHMQWHRSREQNGATLWLRERVVAVSRRLGLMA